MASTVQAVYAIACAAGIHPLSFDGRTRPLRASGHISLTGRGGGRAINHADARELMHTTLALAAPGAMQVVEVVQTLSELTWLDRQAGDFASLGAELEARITLGAQRILRGEPAQGGSDWALSLSTDPPAAWMTWTIDGQQHHRHYATPAGEQGRPLMHIVRIGKEIIDCAAELLADSLLGNIPKRETAGPVTAGPTARTGIDDDQTCYPDAVRSTPARLSTGKSGQKQDRSSRHRKNTG
jgi:hypothetical protein